MAFPRRLLIPNEDLVLDLRPHWIALVTPGVVTLLVLGAWIFLLPRLPDGSLHDILFWLVVVAGIVILVGYPLRHVVRWATSHFVVTSERVIHRQGLIAKRSMEIPLEKINDVRFQQGVLERMVGAGDLVLESAGEQGHQVFSEIRHPEEVQRTIYHQGEQNQRRASGGGGGLTPPGAPSTTTELQRLAELRDRGVLTEDEFQAQKRKILGQA